MNDVFVETGTFKGGAISIALRVGFEKIRSVEVHKPFYDECVERFKDCSTVQLYLGDSITTLWSMIEDITVPITFWLDGHICELPGSTIGQKNIPLLEELEIISRHPIKTHTILVDDRKNLGQPWYDWSPVTERVVITAIKKINQNYTILFEDSSNTPQDILVGVTL
jgi:hypothetical protein